VAWLEFRAHLWDSCQSCLANPMRNKIDALLTLTELSLLSDKAVLPFAFLSFNLNHLAIHATGH
jgi:hypothetical protein